ncbi:hypothetical protein CDL12_11375 [Handroanthus impetiginosus]|uniref:Dirigent protein n=1 Tax=Handroanthus impetiginosus TaxID=429701 RepID=A0A2G9HEQ5_9LAMI|nr:hypothetical protein CDL12_11375 [Handroanthus impetiginosus]
MESGKIFDSFLEALTGLCSNGFKMGSKTEEERFRQLLESKAVLHFYIQDALAADHPTAWEVARSAITNTSDAISFRQVRVLDDLITEEPDRSSSALGRPQGMITFSDMEKEALTMNLNF